MFYLKVARGFQRPRSIMPKIFSQIDSQMKVFFAGKRTDEILAALPQGQVEFGDRWVESRPFRPNDTAVECFIRGKVDTVLALDDNSYAVIDFKTAATRSEHIPLYGRQLHAYALALEQAPPGKFSMSPASRLGLVVYKAQSLAAASLDGPLTWIEMEPNDTAFLAFVAEMLEILAQPEPPAGSPSCEWCAYRDTSRRTGL